MSSRAGKYSQPPFNLTRVINIIFSLSDKLGKEITKECSRIFPLENVLIKKVKVLKKPKFDLTKLMELYTDKPEAVVKAETPANALADK